MAELLALSPFIVDVFAVLLIFTLNSIVDNVVGDKAKLYPWQMVINKSKNVGTTVFQKTEYRVF